MDRIAIVCTGDIDEERRRVQALVLKPTAMEQMLLVAPPSVADALKADFPQLASAWPEPTREVAWPCDGLKDAAFARAALIEAHAKSPLSEVRFAASLAAGWAACTDARLGGPLAGVRHVVELCAGDVSLAQPPRLNEHPDPLFVQGRLTALRDAHQIEGDAGAREKLAQAGVAMTAPAAQLPVERTLVSAVIAHKDLAHTLPATLDSLRAQTWPLEIIVVDDGSGPDDLAKLEAEGARDPALRIFRQANAGPGSARNHGVREARGELVLFVDADNLLRPNLIERLATALQQRPDASAATCAFRRFDDASGATVNFYCPVELEPATLFVDNTAGDACSLHRRKDFLRAGGFTEDISLSEDWELWLRYADLGLRTCAVPEVLFDYRMLPTSRGAKRKGRGYMGTRMPKLHPELFQREVLAAFDYASVLYKNEQLSAIAFARALTGEREAGAAALAALETKRAGLDAQLQRASASHAEEQAAAARALEEEKSAAARAIEEEKRTALEQAARDLSRLEAMELRAQETSTEGDRLRQELAATRARLDATNEELDQVELRLQNLGATAVGRTALRLLEGRVGQIARNLESWPGKHILANRSIRALDLRRTSALDGSPPGGSPRMTHARDSKDHRISQLEILTDRLDRLDAHNRAAAEQHEAMTKQIAQLVSGMESVLQRLEQRSPRAPLRLPRPIAKLGRSARRNLIRPKLFMAATPNSEVRQLDQPGRWVSTGADPSFALHPHGGRFPTGWIQVEIEISIDAITPTAPLLYVDHGAGYSETTAVPLPRPQGGVIRTLLRMDEPVVALRFDPVAADASSFALGTISLQEMGKVEAGMRMVAPLAREVLADPKLALRAVNSAVKTVRADGMRGIKQKLKARHASTASTYSDWVAAFDTLTDEDHARIRARIEEMEAQPLISIVMPVYQTKEVWLRRAIESVLAQLYENWELCIADDASKGPEVRRILEEYAARDARIQVVFREENGHIAAASNSALELATGEYIALLDHDDELPAHALYLFAEEMNKHPDADLLYSDEDKLDEQGRRYGPHFKPDWDPELFNAQNYFCHLGMYRTELVRRVGGFRPGLEGSQDYDLALRCMDCTDWTAKVRHIPHVLYHWRAIEGSTAKAAGEKDYAFSAAEQALRDHLLRTDPAAALKPGLVPGYHRVQRPQPDPAPLVSIIIPTRDGFKILKRCIESIYQSTAYPRFELLIVDNQSKDPATLDYLAQLQAAGRARIIPFDADFNYSAINNHAVAQATGELLCLLNNDVEIIDPEWLSELVSQAVRPGVGAVGARLLYPDGKIQHAGVITGMGGVAGHIFKGMPRDAHGYFGRAQLVQQMTVVTAACLCVRREIYQEVGGLDAENLSVAFNDVDFCLRVASAGYRNIYTPHALLYHHESYSRGSDDRPETKPRFMREVHYMLERWGELLKRDPAYNPNLSLNSDFALAWPPRASWRTA